MKHKISFKELPQANETTGSPTFAMAANGKRVMLWTRVPIMLTFNALSHWVEDRAGWLRQTESLHFFYGLCTCHFLHPRPRLKLCKHPPPPSSSPEVTLVRMNTWSLAFLWKHLGGAKVNFTCHNKVSPGPEARIWQPTEESLFLLINMFSPARGGEREPSYLWGWLKRHSQGHRHVFLETEQEDTMSFFKGNT